MKKLKKNKIYKNNCGEYLYTLKSAFLKRDPEKREYLKVSKQEAQEWFNFYQPDMIGICK